MNDQADADSGKPPAAGGADRVALRKLQRHPAYLHVKQGLRAVRQALPNAWRGATQRYRQLPAAVIVGAGKAGTTQLYAYLTRHPRCFGGVEKETNYFSHYADRPLAWYRSQFPLRRTVERVQGLALEASPSYLANPDALRRMADVLPNASIIAILRDPVARAFSQYQHERQRRREPRSFDDLVREAVESTFIPANVVRYISRGYYSEHLEVLLKVYPPSQIMILDSGDLFDDTNATCQQVFDFLGLERFDVQPQKVYNRGYYRETIDPSTAAALREHYRPHDERLALLLRRRFRWMADREVMPTDRSAA